VISTLPASFTLVLPPQNARNHGRPGTICVVLSGTEGRCPPGVYPIRIESSGISNVLLFTLGTYPEVTEEESQPNSLPNRTTPSRRRTGPISSGGGQRHAPRSGAGCLPGVRQNRRTAACSELEARRCGSAIDPVLRILDGSGKQLARSDDAPGAGLDARLDFTFPSEGNYYVEITDARFSTQTQNSTASKWAPTVTPTASSRWAAVAGNVCP